ncbi:MAG: F0F1 ATP synthase subunit A [Chloroflexi bacterium]|nr:MAG: F0F1 ATP synthase subunit A [Chloroflexota bacterium]
MQLSPDELVFWRWGPIVLNATIVYTWLVMAILSGGAYLATRNLSPTPTPNRWQNLLESLVTLISEQIEQIMGRKPDPFLPFIGALFLFISVANLLSIVPVYRAPTGSLATTAALAACVFVAIPVFGIAQQGLGRYLRLYIQPSVFMLPFNILGELSRTLALAIRLFGNVMSGELIVAILLSITPLVFPVIMQLLGLLIGQIQAYIFAVLATVYIASALRTTRTERQTEDANELGAVEG